MSREEIRRELKLLRSRKVRARDKEELKSKYTDAIALLPPFEAHIMREYYLEHRTHEQIAAEIYYSADTVRRILKRGITMLWAKVK